jgi:hypothetical protein
VRLVGNLGGVVGLILLVWVVAAAQAELAARVLPCLPLAVPVKAKLRQLLAQLRRGLFLESHPNPLTDNFRKVVGGG